MQTSHKLRLIQLFRSRERSQKISLFGLRQSPGVESPQVGPYFET